MMTFTYEEDGITVTMETDATSLYEDYSHGSGILGYFQRFLAACGYTFYAGEELSVVNESDMVVNRQQYLDDMEELEEFRTEAKANKAISQAWRESDPGWTEWHGGEFPFDRGRRVEVELRNGDRLTLTSLEVDWHHNEADPSDDIIAYRVLE